MKKSLKFCSEDLNVKSLYDGLFQFVLFVVLEKWRENLNDDLFQSSLFAVLEK